MQNLGVQSWRVSLMRTFLPLHQREVTVSEATCASAKKSVEHENPVF